MTAWRKPAQRPPTPSTRGPPTWRPSRSRPPATWVFGEERYSRLLRERENLAFDARSLREMGQKEYDRLDAEMRELALRIRGTEDWRAVIEEANDDHPRTEEAMRDAYEVWTARARDFLAETGLVTLPEGERCLVEPSPVFQRPLIGVASYIGPPAFSDSTVGHFFVPFAPDGASEEEKQERLKSNSNGGIPTTSVHEAYPGHHWHIVMRRLYAERIRRVYGTPYFTEGWALYAERVMRERGFFNEPIHELYHLEATIFRAARIIVDTSLHLGEMTYDEAVTFMTAKAGLPEVTARAEVGRYCWWPTQASAYLTGCLEILRIRDRWLAARGLADVPKKDLDAAVLREFHDALATSGALPLGLAERAVMVGTVLAAALDAGDLLAGGPVERVAEVAVPADRPLPERLDGVEVTAAVAAARVAEVADLDAGHLLDDVLDLGDLGGLGHRALDRAWCSCRSPSRRGPRSGSPARCSASSPAAWSGPGRPSRRGRSGRPWPASGCP